MTDHNKEKWEGRAQQMTGQVKEKAGEVTDNEDLAAEGRADQMKGEVKETAGEAQDKVREATR
jgi:uncharacterized protein YjbJ (UPF0337 family)